MTETNKYTKYLVKNLFRCNKIAGRNVPLNWYFASATLAKWCLEKRVSIVGTMKTDRKKIPKEMKKFGNHDEKSTKFCYSKDNKMLLTSYIDKKNLRKTKVIVLSTIHKDLESLMIEEKSHYNCFIWPYKRRTWYCGRYVLKGVGSFEIKRVDTECISLYSR